MRSAMCCTGKELGAAAESSAAKGLAAVARSIRRDADDSRAEVRRWAQIGRRARLAGIAAGEQCKEEKNVKQLAHLYPVSFVSVRCR